MKLQKFNLIGNIPVLLNTSMILSSGVNRTGSYLNYRYLKQVSTFQLQESYEDFITALLNYSKFNVELLILKVLSRDELVIGRYMPINLNYVYLCERHHLGSKLICDGEILGLSAPVYFIVEETLEQIELAQVISSSGTSSIELESVSMVEGDNLITHNSGSKLKGLFISINGMWQSWPFNFGSGEDELSEADQLTKVYIPYGEEGTVNLSLIF